MNKFKSDTHRLFFTTQKFTRDSSNLTKKNLNSFMNGGRLR